MINNNELKQAKFLSVSALNRYLAYKFDIDNHLQTVYLEGEISNFKTSGKHMYFSIKDEFSEISGMMFYPNTIQLDFVPKDGMVVQMVGKIGVYEKRGTYSIVVKKMIQAGIGLLYQEFIDLKDKLQKEGLFDQQFKKKLPEYVETIGVITSATGEAINDIVSTLNKRMPSVKVVLYPSLVQGSDAPSDLVRALMEAYNNKNLDCIIIGRGGGSFEDLACFNDEKLARCLFKSPIPTISAVGHEGDYTICDFVASMRAPTPTGAAMIAVKDQKELLETISIFKQRLNSGCRVYFNNLENRINNLISTYGIAKFDKIIKNYDNRANLLVEKLKKYSPIHIIEKQETTIKYNTQKINTAFEKYLNKIENNIDKKNDKLILLNPLNLMKKGYSITYQNNNVISSIKDINSSENLNIKFVDGQVTTKILKINEE